LKQRLAEAASELSHGAPIGEWEAWRDRHLVELLQLQTTSRALEPRDNR